MPRPEPVTIAVRLSLSAVAYDRRWEAKTALRGRSFGPRAALKAVRANEAMVRPARREDNARDSVACNEAPFELYGL